MPGTKVWTNTGTVAIEKVQAGDFVLSQNVETGELGYKPVSATTVGTPLPLVEIRPVASKSAAHSATCSGCQAQAGKWPRSCRPASCWVLRPAAH